MQQAAVPNAIASRPSHVALDLVCDFDIYDPPGGRQDVHAAWAQLQKGPPIVWTPRNGGHWIATRAQDIVDMQMNWETFSHESINIPRNPTPSLPLECDPPMHTALRSIISPLFSPDTLRFAEAEARNLAISLTEGMRSRGGCNFKNEFALLVPITVFLKLVDLPLEGRTHLLELVERRTRSPSAEERNAAKRGLIAFMQAAIAERRANPGRDFISRILHARVNERPLTPFEIENVLATVLSGGLDTVATMMSFAFAALARNPDLAKRLVADKSAIPRAVDEMIRRHGLANTSRLISRDVEIKGASLRKGESIVLPTALVGLDEALFRAPFEIDIDRSNATRHASFGNGIHRCPGANLGRMEIRVVMEEWLARIPVFRIDEDKPFVTASGVVSTLQELHLQWDV